MSYANYVYTDDQGNAWAVGIPADFATALGQTVATTQSYIDNTISPRYAIYRDSSQNVRTAIIDTQAHLSNIVGSTLTVSGIIFTCVSAFGEQRPPIQQSLLVLPQGPQGPPGPQGPAGVNTITTNHVYVGNASNIAADVAMSGDATILASGALTIANNAVTNAKLAQAAANSVKGNNTAGTGNVIDLSEAQLTAMINTFGSSLSGAVPSSGGGTANFLRADGTWHVPSGTGSTITVTQAVLASDFMMTSAAVAYDILDLTLPAYSNFVVALAMLSYNPTTNYEQDYWLVDNSGNIIGSTGLDPAGSTYGLGVAIIGVITATGKTKISLKGQSQYASNVVKASTVYTGATKCTQIIAISS